MRFSGGSFKIRSDIGNVNSENRRTYGQRVEDEQFGIFRPVCREQAEQLKGVLYFARFAVNNYLGAVRGGSGSADLYIPNDFGVTFVMNQHVRGAMKRGMLQRGFSHAQLERRIESTPELQETETEVAIGGLRWVSQHNRKLAVSFSQTPEYDYLGEQSEALHNVLHEVNAGVLAVAHPNHVTLMRYGHDGDRLDLNQRHRDGVADIIQHHLDDAQIGSVRLDGLVVGKSYSQPFERAGNVA
jgi:hypothetical protein